MREPIGLLSKAAAVGAAHWASPAVEDGCCAFFSPPWAKAQAKAKNHNRRLREVTCKPLSCTRSVYHTPAGNSAGYFSLVGPSRFSIG